LSAIWWNITESNSNDRNLDGNNLNFYLRARPVFRGLYAGGGFMNPLIERLNYLSDHSLLSKYLDGDLCKNCLTRQPHIGSLCSPCWQELETPSANVITVDDDNLLD
jgi:hypothetical protein